MFCSKCGKELPNGSLFCSKCGKKLPINIDEAIISQTKVNQETTYTGNGCIYSIDGVRGKHIDVYEKKCIIKVKPTIGSILVNTAMDGEKTIYYKDCVGIQFKPSNFAIGYLQLETSSGATHNFFGENSFTFDTSVISNEKMEEVANYIKAKIEEIKNGEGVVFTTDTSSPTEELKKMKELLDLDIITKEEFDAKKKQILGL